MEWRPIDNLIASACVQKIQELIKSGELEATDIIPVIRSEKAAEIRFNAWRVYLLDRMANEYDKQDWSKTSVFADTGELDHDIKYYNKVVEREKQGQPYQASDMKGVSSKE
jgi:hypothetical protein